MKLLRRIEGVGEARARDYGQEVLALVHTLAEVADSLDSSGCTSAHPQPFEAAPKTPLSGPAPAGPDPPPGSVAISSLP